MAKLVKVPAIYPLILVLAFAVAPLTAMVAEVAVALIVVLATVPRVR
jgi:hypothetical protein